MRIIDGLKLEGDRVEIPDCGREDLPQFFVDMGFKEGVEVGLYRGMFCEKLCQAGLKMHGIDPYHQTRDYHHKRRNFKRRCEEIYEEAKKRMAPYDCNVIRKTSVEAAKDFKDESIDFVYIDGNHLLKYVVEDIHTWTPKVKRGGIISGHDYVYTKGTNYSFNVIQVRYAVDAWVSAYHIKPFYVLGERNAKPGEKRDRWRSWFWIKK